MTCDPPRSTKNLNTSGQENIKSKLARRIETLNLGVNGFQQYLPTCRNLHESVGLQFASGCVLLR